MITDNEIVNGITQRVYINDRIRCADISHLLGYTIPETGDIILCPAALPPRMNSILGNNRFRDYEGTTQDIDKITRVTSRYLFHEMFHALWDYESKLRILICLFLFHITGQINF